MRIAILVLFLSGVFIYGYSQPEIEWSKNYGGSYRETANFVLPLPGEGYLIMGKSESSDEDLTENEGENDCWVFKTDLNGSIIWQLSFGGSNQDFAKDAVRVSTGGFLIVGYSNSEDGLMEDNYGSIDGWVFMLDEDGNLLWEKNFGGPNWDSAYSVIETSEGNFVITGRTGSFEGDLESTNGLSDFWVFKIDPLGNSIWHKNYGGSDLDEARRIKETSENNYLVIGTIESVDDDISTNYGDKDIWVIKLDNDGNLIWEKNFGGSAYDLGVDIEVMADDSFVILGSSGSNDIDLDFNHGQSDIWVAKSDSNGNIEWQFSYGGTISDSARDINTTEDGGYIVCGRASSVNGDLTGNQGGADYWTFKIDHLGQLQWQLNLGGSALDEAVSIAQTDDLGYCVLGTSRSDDGDVSNLYGEWDFWFVKLSPEIEIQIDENENNNCVQVYPNPSSGAFELKLDCPLCTTFSPKIYDCQGRLLHSLSNDSLSKHNIQTPGLYFIRSCYGSQKLLIE